MMHEVALTRWTAWAPEVETAAAWRQWAATDHALKINGAPKISFLQPLLRRRLSRLSKMALEVSFRVCDPAERSFVRPIFASRHGESGTTIALLNNIADNELFSPTAFSHSVHNTAVGYFSIAAENKLPGTALAAGRETICYALLQAITLLDRFPDSPVLVVFTSEPQDEVYHPWADEPQLTYGVGMLLQRPAVAPGNACLLRLDLLPAHQALIPSISRPYGLEFIRWLLDDADAITIAGEGQDWKWSRGGELPHSLFADTVR